MIGNESGVLGIIVNDSDLFGMECHIWEIAGNDLVLLWELLAMTMAI